MSVNIRRAALARSALLTAALLGAATLPAYAQNTYPQRPIKMIVPMPPGGGTDTISRIIADSLLQKHGWTVVIENKPGATGNIGMASLAKSAPDAYTIGMGQAANLAINPWLYSSMPFDPVKDFTPIVLVASQPVVLVVRGDSPHKTVDDLLKAAKARSGAVKMASSGAGTIGHMSGELLGRKAGVKFLHVPYKGAGQALTDLMGGQTDFFFSVPQAAYPMIRTGKLRALAVSSPQRLAALPAVPTVAESGFPGFESSAWTGLVAPAGVSLQIVNQINARVQATLKDPHIVKKLQEEGSEPLGGSPAHFARFIQDEGKKWGDLVRVAGIKLE
ncbi:Bug family tripartite tricarboxylate transporter substrate binding protein [Cupriavidus nantongensis]|uniref:LacI family transcriptional regulator n=1 Tax=Cupriavidus nantongensis TaxID=1796606 RepID=A0A142JR29_9BURK|nr:tripartite tricarboxylate transporter substrate binding protein [Cupriavidus nantongensis]AMR80541.1 LacI family transcriptional regulator [Cupriavidus nantongensis]